MSGSSTAGNETVTSSASVETQSSISPQDGRAIGLDEIGLVEPHDNHGKTRGEKRKGRKRKENNGVLTSDSTVERETAGSPVDMTILPNEPEGSKGKPGGRKGKKGTISNSSIERPSKEMSVVPHDPEGADGQTKRRKCKKRGRHFDREVRAHILQVCLPICCLCALLMQFLINLSCVAV
jgi:snRNA-activating protein complex subunit 3